MAKCMFCDSERGPVCYTCRRVTGVREMPPMRRELSPCKRCNHAKLIRVIPRELSVQAVRIGQIYENNQASYAPMYATYPIVRSVEKRIFSADEVAIEPPQPHEGHGMFETYICKRCGFTEWFCHDPESIPIGPEYMTEEIDSDGSAPYR